MLLAPLTRDPATARESRSSDLRAVPGSRLMNLRASSEAHRGGRLATITVDVVALEDNLVDEPEDLY